MAKLFLSYSRTDEGKARSFCDWLQREGHDVWRDEDDIGGGASFSSEIEAALKDCEAVLVLWSAESVQSAWVRDEAAFGRDARKLIPFSLDGTEPPLGFRQFQSINLSRWKGRGDSQEAERIRRSIARVTGVALDAPAPQSSANSRPRFAVSRPRLNYVAITIAALAVLSLFLWQPWTADRQIEIAVLPSPQSSDRAMAADYANAAAADLASFLPRRFDRATVIAPADATGKVSGYRMEISADSHGAGANVTLTLSDRAGGGTLWSDNWTATDASAAGLKAEVSAAASKAALCLTDARGGSRRLSQPALGLYLNGCTELGGTKLSNAEFVRIFERVTEIAPDFARAWDYLALSRSWIAEALRNGAPAAYAPALRSARETIATARRLNPSSAMSYDAEYHLVSNDIFGGLKVLEQGARIDPDDGRVQMHLSDSLRYVGRISDSLEAGERGVELAPDSPYTRYQHIVALVYSGQFSKANAEIADARKKWPNEFAIDLADFSLQSRYGDPRLALQLLPKIANSSDAKIAVTRKVIAARLDPTKAKIDDAISALETQSPSDPDIQNTILLALGNFGRVDQVYQLLQDPKFQPFVETEALFRPDFAAVRADPRFMSIAARLGLVRYWRNTGYWPDFCSSEKLPYDCKTEAAKYR